MCGIVGYIGKQRAVPILLDGLKSLEYRGYDSAGLAVFEGQRVVAEKAVGKVKALEEKVGSLGDSEARVGIAHTRWATHGGVTEANAHPHSDCGSKIWVVHNGIIENYKELKEKLMGSGHFFKSETDTEVIPHLIESFLKDKSADSLEEAVRQTLKLLKGTYGLVVLSADEPDLLVAARNFSPLLMGVGNDEYLIASDASAVLKHTKNVIYLDDGEMAVVTRNEHHIYDLNRNSIDKKTHTLDWDIESARKDGYPHFMLKEIMAEPEAIGNSTRGRLLPDDGNVVLGGLKDVERILRDAERVIISACGSAYLAGRVGEYMLEEYAGIPTEVDIASEFRYRKPVFRENDVLLVISQSGETADTLASLREAKEKNVPTLGIVNVVGSTISRYTDAGVYQHIGPEIGVAATKSFVSQASILALLTVFLGRKREMSITMGKRIVSELQKIPELMKGILQNKEVIKNLAVKYKDYEHFFYLGRKYNLPVAIEGALKIKEIAYVHAEGYGAGELKHGPIALIDKNFPTFAIAPQDSVYEKMVSNIEEIKARGGPVIAIGTEGDKSLEKVADDVIYIPKTLEMLTPLLTVVPLHLFAYYVGVEKGYDVDRPRNLAKSVTVE
ncbi:MAG: glutamine--fructose-6-phosphate transaminase (isomerizing) [Candidatus Colwellbacteria bacterium]|nr:glutamine--fructose-6-phosphate transaminase (isomerizing) [Candidatus Colwellbacteria bacterium]MBI3274213.1 glutamine--fructose-6-phosphate transaminase (isomerizing) [Candidatus Colwellbacteria bacterium]